MFIIEENITQLSEFIEIKNIVIEKEITNENFEFWGDKNEINKVIMILLVNAINATKSGGKIVLGMSVDGKFLKCCISTNGKNYSDNLKRMIFEGIIVSDGWDYGVGDGVFLYLVKLIVNAHNGKVYINNKVDGGSIFCIELEKFL